VPAPVADEDEDEGEKDRDETIGKSAAAKLASSISSTTNFTSGDYKPTTTTMSAISPSPSSSRRIRAQSTYGFSNLSRVPQTPVTPLRPRIRSRSIDRIAVGERERGPTVLREPEPEREPPTPFGSKFVDPLVLRRQDRETKVVGAGKPVGKVPIGQLVAFFDGEKR